MDVHETWSLVSSYWYFENVSVYNLKLKVALYVISYRQPGARLFFVVFGDRLLFIKSSFS